MFSVTKPVFHSAEFAVPESPSVPNTFDSKIESSVGLETSSASEFENIVTEQVSLVPHILTQEDLQDLIRDLNLSIEKSELVISIKAVERVEKGVNIRFFRKPQFELFHFFV